MVGILSAVLIYFTQPVWWKVQLLVRIGQVNPTRTIESMQASIDRLKSSGFIGDVSRHLNNEGILKLLDPDEGAALTARSTRSSDLLEITVINSDREIAQTTASAVFFVLKSRHDAFLKDIIASNVDELGRTDLEVEVMAKRLRSVTEKPLESDRSAAILMVLEIQKQLEMKVNRAIYLRDSLSSFTLRSTSLVETSVVRRRYLSSLWRTFFGGAIFGLAFAALWIRFEK